MIMKKKTEDARKAKTAAWNTYLDSKEFKNSLGALKNFPGMELAQTFLLGWDAAEKYFQANTKQVKE